MQDSMQSRMSKGGQPGVLRVGLLASSAQRDKASYAEEALERLRQAIVTGNLRPNHRDINQFIELNSAFHNELFSACGNEQLWSLLRTFRDQSFDRRIVRVFTAADWRAMITQHQRMLDAVRQGNARLAEKAVHEHVRTAVRLAVERL